MTYNEWAARHPQAAAELQELFQALPQATTPEGGDGKSEAWAQQRTRMQVARYSVPGPYGPVNAMAWRNNVGATPAKTRHTCPRCQFHYEERQQPVRYGLANDSAQLNAQIKSADLILAIPRLIQPHHVGQVIAQFGSIESKRPGWKFTGQKQEEGQAAWAALITRIGGYAAFSTGDIAL